MSLNPSLASRSLLIKTLMPVFLARAIPFLTPRFRSTVQAHRSIRPDIYLAIGVIWRRMLVNGALEELGTFQRYLKNIVYILEQRGVRIEALGALDGFEVSNHRW